MSEMVANKRLALQKEAKISTAIRSREKVAIRKRINISPGMIAGCFQFNRLIFY
jgi:hypothetical protein